MSYLFIPTPGSASHRRVDFATIAELFVADEPESAAPPGRLLQAASTLRRLMAPVSETLGLLRDEALVRKLEPHGPPSGVARAFGV